MPTYYVLPQNKVLFSRTATGSCIFTIYLSEVHSSNLSFDISYTSTLGSPLGIIGSPAVINAGQLSKTFTVTASSIDTFYINVACVSIEPYSFECILSNITVGENPAVGIRDWLGELTEETFSPFVGIRDWLGELTEETFSPFISITGFTPSEVSFGSIPPTGMTSEGVGVLNTSLNLIVVDNVFVNTSLSLLSGTSFPVSLTLKEVLSGSILTSLSLANQEPPVSISTALTLSKAVTMNCLGLAVVANRKGVHLSNLVSRFRGRRETVKITSNLKAFPYHMQRESSDIKKILHMIEYTYDYYTMNNIELYRKIQKNRFQIAWRI